MITKRLSWYSPYSPDLNPIEFIWKSIKKVISIVFVENVNLQRAYHLLSRGSKSLSHRGFSFVGDYKHRHRIIKSARRDVNIGKRVSKFDTPDKGAGGDSSRVEEK